MQVWSTLSYGVETEVQRGAAKTTQQVHSRALPGLLAPAILYPCAGKEVREEAEALGEVGATRWQLGPFRFMVTAGTVQEGRHKWIPVSSGPEPWAAAPASLGLFIAICSP